MKTYLVECYLPRARSTELAEIAARLATLDGTGRVAVMVRYLRSTYVPADEICFHQFEADSIEAVRDIARLASLPFDRIVEAEESHAEG